MNHDPNISATLIGANSRAYGHLAMPDRMMPESDDPYSTIKEKGQLCGSNPELVCELAGRVCYDSLGKGRSSEEYHKHIQEVGHGSVLEHINFTVGGEIGESELLWLLSWAKNRPGVWLIHDWPSPDGPASYRLSMNLRAVVEMRQWNAAAPINTSEHRAFIECFEQGVSHCARQIAPQIIDAWGLYSSFMADVQLLEPVTEEEKWVTMLLTGSRGFSHELVRHGDRTAISQRSTRYVDEDGSPWVEHPLITKWLEDELADGIESAADLPKSAIGPARQTYHLLVEMLQSWLGEKGIKGVAARKQARGAARGYLGNALYTEVIFSASVAQWKRILAQRASQFADAEIREVAVQALTCLQQCPYADCFTGYTVKESPDGIGEIAEITV